MLQKVIQVAERSFQPEIFFQLLLMLHIRQVVIRDLNELQPLQLKIEET